MSPRYFEELSPGHGTMPPRAATASNAPRLDLNGDWAFRFSPVGLDETDGFELPGFHDQGWDRLPVPSHWQLHGHGKPAYLNIPYPIPLDPPYRVLATGLAVLCLAGTALVLLVTVTHAGLAWIALALFLTACPVGMILPTTTALSLQRAPHAAGSASALLGTTQFLMGALAPALAGLGGQSTALPMAISVLGLALAAAGCFLALCRPWRSTVDPLTR